MTRLNLMRTLKFKVSRTALERIYISFIRPLLEYSDSVWDNCSNEAKKQLDSIHIEAARIITGATKLCSINKLFVDIGWDSLQNRRNKHKLVIFYKIMNGLTPDYLSGCVPPLVQDTTTYNLRNSNDIQSLHANTNLFYNSFFSSTIRAWNSLPEDIKQATSVASFKYRLNKDIKKPPKYYNAGTRIGQILQARMRMECSSLNSHLNKDIKKPTKYYNAGTRIGQILQARMRMECSSLNSHLYRKNIVSTPSCQCGGFESPYHFFFQCPRYAAARNRFLPNDINRYNTHDFFIWNRR